MENQIGENLKYLENLILPYFDKIESDYCSEDYREMITLWEGVRVTEEMQKMLDKAKKKKMPKSTKSHLEEIRNFYSSIEELFLVENLHQQLINNLRLFVSKAKCEISQIKRVHIEHGDSPTEQQITAFRDNDIDLFEVSVTFDFNPIWNILNSSKWYKLSEKLEGIMVEDVEFLIGFEYMLRLKGYQCLQKGTTTEIFDETINELGLSKGSNITIGGHDNGLGEFEIYSVK